MKSRVHIIVELVSAYYELDPREIYSARRGRLVARPRQIAMWLSRKHTGLSFPQIGRLLDRNHTTVIAGCERIDFLMRRDEILAATVADLSAVTGETLARTRPVNPRVVELARRLVDQSEREMMLSIRAMSNALRQRAEIDPYHVFHCMHEGAYGGSNPCD